VPGSLDGEAPPAVVALSLATMESFARITERLISYLSTRSPLADRWIVAPDLGGWGASAVLRSGEAT